MPSAPSTLPTAPSVADVRAALDDVVTGTVGPAAVDIDRTGDFPRAGIDALGAGLLGVTNSVEHGGSGGTLADVAHVVERLAAACGSTAMVALMHYAAAAVVDAHGPRDVAEAIARGEHLTTLAFSESGSRSHFWAPMSTATRRGDTVALDAVKSRITAAGEADSYVWSSRPLAAAGALAARVMAPTTAALRDFVGRAVLGLPLFDGAEA